MAAQLMEGNHTLLILQCSLDTHLTDDLIKQYAQMYKQRCEENAFKCQMNVKKLGQSEEDNPLELFQKMAEKRRSQNYEEFFEKLPVEDVTDNADEKFPILVEEEYVTKKTVLQDDETSEGHTGLRKKMDHLYVLVHGMGGSHNDMRLCMNEIALINTDSQFLLSSCNEGKKTMKDIADSGKLLAKEVNSYLDDFGHEIGQITFIAFSLGGLMLRTALPYFEKHKAKMHGFVTFSSPHVGYASHNSTMIKSGLWVMSKFVENGAVKQLQMKDDTDFEECFLYKCSEKKGLQWFKHIYLFSSVQDKYIQFDSARMQAFTDTDVGANQTKYTKMINNIWKGVKVPVTRVDVNFVMPEGGSSIMKMIGREAHMQFIQNQKWLRMFTHRYMDTLFVN